MFDIGFAELILICVVGLLVIGPERLPGAIRTGSQWLSQFKRSFNTMKREIEQELEIDSVKNQLNRANEQFKNQSEDIKRSIEDSGDSGNSSPGNDTNPKPQAESPTK
jgi:sec-independent protein translocase protein TatB